MTIIILVAIVVIIFGSAGGFLYWRRRPKQLKMEFYQVKWRELQQLLRDKARWPEAVASADTLLDTALRKKHVRGRSMGERLVKAQRLFTDNDSVWFGHKLRNRISSEPNFALKEKDVKQALVGIRQALKDVGALPESKPEAKPEPPKAKAARPAPKPTRVRKTK